MVVMPVLQLGSSVPHALVGLTALGALRPALYAEASPKVTEVWLREGCDMPKVTQHGPGLRLRLTSGQLRSSSREALSSIQLWSPDLGSPWAAANVSGSWSYHGHLRNLLTLPRGGGVPVSQWPLSEGHDLVMESHLQGQHFHGTFWKGPREKAK